MKEIVRNEFILIIKMKNVFSFTLPTMMLQSSISNYDEEIQNEIPMDFILEFFLMARMFLRDYIHTYKVVEII